MTKELYIQIFTSLLVSGSLTSGLIWLTKSIISERLKNAIKHEYDEKLASHKSKLEAQSKLEIEELKSKLHVGANERNNKFQRLHEERANVVSETYALLKNVFITLNAYTKAYQSNGDPSIEERRDAARFAHQKYNSYYQTKLIYLPKHVTDKINSINSEFITTFNQFFFAVDSNIATGRQDIEKWMNITTKINGEIKEALEELECEFRNILGDES